jgi:hypothetical protein
MGVLSLLHFPRDRSQLVPHCHVLLEWFLVLGLERYISIHLRRLNRQIYHHRSEGAAAARVQDVVERIDQRHCVVEIPPHLFAVLSISDSRKSLYLRLQV